MRLHFIDPSVLTWPTTSRCLQLCRKHHFGLSRMEQMVRLPDSQTKSLAKTWNSIKSAAENVKPRKV